MKRFVLICSIACLACGLLFAGDTWVSGGFGVQRTQERLDGDSYRTISIGPETSAMVFFDAANHFGIALNIAYQFPLLGYTQIADTWQEASFSVTKRSEFSIGVAWRYRLLEWLHVAVSLGMHFSEYAILNPSELLSLGVGGETFLKANLSEPVSLRLGIRGNFDFASIGDGRRNNYQKSDAGAYFTIGYEF